MRNEHGASRSIKKKKVARDKGLGIVKKILLRESHCAWEFEEAQR